MSWLPDSDPVPGDKHSCDAIEHVIVPRSRDLGGFAVRRALPSAKTQMVGPFIFFDQMGPAEFILGNGIDVRPHPHIGLATVTYLFEGEIWHRDSLGTSLAIKPGEVNLMTAGRGIAHSERETEQAKTQTRRLFGIQAWCALPKAHEDWPVRNRHAWNPNPAQRRVFHSGVWKPAPGKGLDSGAATVAGAVVERGSGTTRLGTDVRSSTGAFCIGLEPHADRANTATVDHNHPERITPAISCLPSSDARF